MFALIKNNIIKVVEDENSRDKLISKGFKIYLEEATKENIEKKEEKIEKVKSISNDLFNLSKPELMEIAKGKNIKGYSTKTKEELVEILDECNA
ncbi:Rho termination factor N-terminal domain-containing protein [Clostridioides sp. ZZV14-6387]|uniref:Rho termination factor N-terminal domain-containing protein n=1 Tax=Clostridioides sp. ZZV14-6387 TaxID=2811497 RepID=UPI001D12BD2C|nr:Rho termination factor N-terminal domain-containing protein [Clostridioides sp. ZZV14-6387]